MITEELVSQLREEVKLELDLSQSTTDQFLYAEIEEIVFGFSRTHMLTASEKRDLVKRIFYSLRGLDVLQPLLEDPTVTEIMVNNHQQIFVEKEGRTYQTQLAFESEQKLEDIIQNIVAKVNRVVNESSPIVDARLQDGSRVHVVLPPITLKGPTLTIRKFPEKPVTMEELIKWNALSQDVAQFLRQLVIAKYNIFISGGTGSGKTTMLNALSNFIPADERVITIEDSAELQIPSIPNLVSMETRNANTEGKGEITIRDLIKASLRMRPNRIVVGEVRGGEALDMLQAMNTGHDGSLSTGHANSVKDMLSRLETMVLSGASLPIEVIRKQMSSALDVMLHLSRLRDKSRRVMEISEVLEVQDGVVMRNPLYTFKDIGEDKEGRVQGEWVRTGNQLKNTQKLKRAGIPIE